MMKRKIGKHWLIVEWRESKPRIRKISLEKSSQEVVSTLVNIIPILAVASIFRMAGFSIKQTRWQRLKGWMSKRFERVSLEDDE